MAQRGGSHEESELIDERWEKTPQIRWDDNVYHDRILCYVDDILPSNVYFLHFVENQVGLSLFRDHSAKESKFRLYYRFNESMIFISFSYYSPT